MVKKCNILAYPEVSDGGCATMRQELNSEYLNNEQVKIKEVSSEIKFNFSSVTHIKKVTNLSDREIEVLNIIGHGYNTKIAAQKLNITERTVKFHVEEIKNKAGLHFKHELIHLYEKVIGTFYSFIEQFY